MKIYVDTNVYLDYFLDRKRAEPAFKLFSNVLACKHRIMLSDHVIDELRRYIDLENTSFLFQMLERKIVKIRVMQKDIIEAAKIETHKSDALHIVLARRADAEAIVTRNIDDFPSFKTYRPEEL